MSASESPLPTSRLLSAESREPLAHFASLVCGFASLVSCHESAQLSCSLLEEIIGSRQACSEAAGSGVPVAAWVKTLCVVHQSVTEAFICAESTHASAKGFCRDSLQASIGALIICLLRSSAIPRSSRVRG